MTTTFQIIDSFRAAMAEAGMIVNEPITADGRLHRCHVDGDKRGTKNGAYILHLDGRPAGFFEHFKSGIRQTWAASGQRQPMTQAMRQEIEAERLRRAAEQAERHKATAKKAQYINSVCKPAPADFPYLAIKKIKPHDARITRDSKALVNPLFDRNGKVVNLQFIDAEGNKRFLSGGQKKGCFAVIGEHLDGGTVLICEGWATGASLHEKTGCFVVVAMDAGNLTPVAEIIRTLEPEADIVICGDNDESGTGQTKARAAALAVGGKYLIPPTPCYDWNDELTRSGE